MPSIYINTDTPYEERVKGLYPLIVYILHLWAEGILPYSEFSEFMDYIDDEIESLDGYDNFGIGTIEWRWGSGQLLLPEDVPIFIEMLKPENLYSQEVLDKWNNYWNSVNLKQRALDYLKKHPDLSEEELRDALNNLPSGDNLPFSVVDEATISEEMNKRNEHYFRKIDALMQEIRTECKPSA